MCSILTSRSFVRLVFVGAALTLTSCGSLSLTRRNGPRYPVEKYSVGIDSFECLLANGLPTVKLRLCYRPFLVHAHRHFCLALSSPLPSSKDNPETVDDSVVVKVLDFYEHYSDGDTEARWRLDGDKYCVSFHAKNLGGDGSLMSIEIDTEQYCFHSEQCHFQLATTDGHNQIQHRTGGPSVGEQ